MTSLSLRQRLLLLTLLPSTLIAIVLVTYFTFSAIRSLEKELHAKGIATVRYLAPVSEYGILAGQYEGLHGLVQAAVQEPGAKAAIMVNSKGRTMAVSGRVSLAADALRQSPAEAQLIAENNQWVAFGAPVWRSLEDGDPLFEPEGKQPTATREIIGAVFVEFDKTELATQQTQLLQRGLMIVVAGLLVLAGLAIAIADNLARPLMRLVHAVRKMSGGDFSVRIESLSTGEIGVLEGGFNDMASHIEETHQSMQARIEEATVQLAYQARHDALTGLINRREFEHRLERTLAGVQAGGDECAVLFIDLDRFKQINDTCGYLAGDELLRQMSQLFLGRLRDDDVLARLGGDEFSILLFDCNRAHARQIAEDICALASAYRFIWQEKVFAIGASIGVTTITRKVRAIGEIITTADSACHQAKSTGRNRICEQDIVAIPERRQEAGHWAARIAGALADGRLLVEAVPMRALSSGIPNRHYVELTARLNENGQPAVELSALQDAAERYDLAEAIDQRMIDTAIAAQARAREQGRGLFCLVPLSRASLSNRQTIEHIAGQLARLHIRGEGLCFLFSEDSLTHSTSQAMEFAREIHRLGCEVGLDDFGGGLASFSHLRSINPGFIKLSRNLTRDLQKNRTASALLRAIREITSDQDIYSITDSVDDAGMLEQVKLLGIDYATGNAIAPREPFEVWLEGAVMR